jgi:hypothetical protein
MATLSHGPRINARTTPDIHNAVKRLALNSTRRGLTFQGRQVSSEAIVSAVLLKFLKWPEDEQVKFLESAFRDLENALL